MPTRQSKAVHSVGNRNVLHEWDVEGERGKDQFQRSISALGREPEAQSLSNAPG